MTYRCDLCDGDAYTGEHQAVRAHIQGSKSGAHKGESFGSAEQHMTELDSGPEPDGEDPVVGDGPPDAEMLKLPCGCDGAEYPVGEPSKGDVYQCESCDRFWQLERSTSARDEWREVTDRV